MTLTDVRQRGDAITNHKSKWHYHPDVISRMLQFRNVELFYEYTSYLEKGGTGSKMKVQGGSTFVNNIYRRKLKLKGEDNILHLNYETYGGDRVKFYSFGRYEAGSNVVKLADQMLMIQHVKGVAGQLSDEQKRRRSEGWMACIVDEQTSGAYYDEELPKIITKFIHLWEDEIDYLDVLNGNVSSQDKGTVREQIQCALQCSNELPGSYPPSIISLPQSVTPSPPTQDMSQLQCNQQDTVRPEYSPGAKRR